ncbi:hypothetical protein [Spirosoma fluminis]
MFPVTWRSGRSHAVAVASVLALLSGCGPTRYAYFQPQRNAIERLASPSNELVASADTLPEASPISMHTSTEASNIDAESPASTPATATRYPALTLRISASRHLNPENHSPKRLGRLFRSIPAAHVAPRMQAIDHNSTNRRTHPLAVIALGVSVLGYVPLLLAASGTLVWVLSVTLPLAAVLMGAASLTTINRNKDRYRGRGWAMAAIMLGTGMLGLALVAIAAVSKVVLQK